MKYLLLLTVLLLNGCADSIYVNWADAAEIETKHGNKVLKIHPHPKALDEWERYNQGWKAIEVVEATADYVWYSLELRHKVGDKR